MPKDEAEETNKMRCSVCGRGVAKLYQRNTCRDCLLHSFKKLTPVIDYYRGGKSGAAQDA